MRVVEVLRTEGVRSFWFKLLGETVYRRVVIMERRLDGPDVDVEGDLPLSVDVLDAAAIDEYVRFRPDADAADIARRLAAGHRAFVARHEGRVVHAGWAAPGGAWIAYLGRPIVLTPGDVYQYDSFTALEFRGRNAAAVRIEAMARRLRAAGYRRLVAVVVPENAAAFRPLVKAGYHARGVMGYVRIGRWRRDFVRVDRRAPARASAYWDGVVTATRAAAPIDGWRAYMRRVYARLVVTWLPPAEAGRGLKTDLFEEAVSRHHLLPDLGPGSVGIDGSPAVVRAARERLAGAGGRHLFVVGDLRRLPLRAHSVARILAGSSLDHFADRADIATSLAELARVLAPGGTLVVTFDNPLNPVVALRNRLPFALLRRLRLVPYYVGATYGPAEVRRRLEALGLAVTAMTAVAHAPRAPAIWLIALAERLGAPALAARVARLLDRFESLERWPTRDRTGYYIAARAEKPARARPREPGGRGEPGSASRDGAAP